YNRTEYYGCVHPLGIMHLGAMLRKEFPGRHEIELHDMILRREMPETTFPRIEAFEPDIVGFSCMTHEASAMHQLARMVRRRFPKARIVVGGPYTGSNPEKILRNHDVDYVVCGEGEYTFNALVKSLEEGNPHPELRGVGYLKDNQYVWSGDVEQSDGERLDAIPFPAWDMIDVEAYYDVPRFAATYARREYMTLFTSRGCPYHCTYCHEIFTKKFHAHSVGRVMAEIDAIVERYGVGELAIVDDIFNIDVKRAKAICDAIVERGYDFRLDFPNGVRADQMTYELLESLKRAGAYRLVYAVESASPRIQKFTKKHVNLTKMQQAINWTDDLGIACHGFFMLGFPGETREEIQTTIDYALNSRLHTANFFVVNPFEGTVLSDQVKEMGIQVNDGETDNFNYFKNNFKLSEVGTADLEKIVKQANAQFYLNPKRIWRLIQVLPNKSQMPRLFLLFLIRSVAAFQSHGQGQKLLDLSFKATAAWGRLASRLFPPKHKQARIMRERARALAA
ncbi:MAG: B12-binding domain-containing radical SAM protein, partial [Candidatus Methylomirabilis sp.]|nr:B12-binding domain-containing radical SAM protein [Deltaproteobacteria bacterium]